MIERPGSGDWKITLSYFAQYKYVELTVFSHSFSSAHFVIDKTVLLPSFLFITLYLTIRIYLCIDHLFLTQVMFLTFYLLISP